MTMKRQMSFAEAESAGKKRVTRRQRFLDEMEKLVPWSRLLTAIEPYYPKGARAPADRSGADASNLLPAAVVRPVGRRAGRCAVRQHRDACLRGIDLAVENVPDATTLLKFRRLLLEHDLTRKLFDEIGISLCERGLMMKEGTLVDATIIEAPSSTKNAEKSRDPEMHQTKKGNEWHLA
jgi:IS5 family transposase